MARKKDTTLDVETITHDAKRANIPTAEYQSVVPEEQQGPVRVAYARGVAGCDEEAWSSLNSNVSRPFDKPASGRIAVKVINHLGDEVMKVFRV